MGKTLKINGENHYETNMQNVGSCLHWKGTRAELFEEIKRIVSKIDTEPDRDAIEDLFLLSYVLKETQWVDTNDKIKIEND